MRRSSCKLWAAACAAMALAPGVACADGLLGELWENTTITGFVRPEIAVRTTSAGNPNNQYGNYFQDRTVERQAYLPPSLNPLSGGLFLLGFTPGEGNVTSGNDWNVPIPLIASDTVRRGDLIRSKDSDFNYSILRAQTELQVMFTDEFRFVGRIRGLYDFGLYNSFDARDVEDLQGGIDGGLPEIYHGEVNTYEYLSSNGRRINPLELAGDDYLVDFPALLFEYNTGDFNIRVGNQQIAWGQTIFYRTLDIPQGLDFRKHLIIDREFEDFSDKRVPTLAVRATYQLGDLLIEGMASKFQPRVYANANTAYNVIPSQFTVHDNYYGGDNDREINYGIKFNAQYGQFGWQALAFSRMNPVGAFRWTKSGVNKPLTGLLGNLVNLAYNIKLPVTGDACDPALCRRYADIGEALANTPLEVAPGGVYTANEWFRYAADARLNGVEGVNTLVSDFEASTDVYGTVVDSYEEAFNELNTFFIAAGGSLRGHIERNYFREEVYGVNVAYVTHSDTHPFFDQIVINTEVQYTPERVYTKRDLGKDYLRSSEYEISLVVEKWYRTFRAFPSQYLVFQYQHRSESDLVGRHLSGYGGSETQAAQGISHADYIVFAVMQPWPGKKYVLEFSSLYDLKGGLFIQPNFQINIGRGMQLELFYNYADTIHGNPYDNLISSVQWADEATVRFTYQF